MPPFTPSAGSPSNGTPSTGTRSSLLRRAQQRDTEAWSELVVLYGPLVQHWCQRCGLDAERTADCVQDVFWAVSKSLNTFESRRADGSFRGWLWTITANKARDLIRRESRHTAPGGSTALRSLNAIAEEQSLPSEEPTSELERTRLLARAIAQMRGEFTERSWEIFERSVIDNVPTAVVAQQFQVTDATVRQIRSRILRRLRQQLGDL